MSTKFVTQGTTIIKEAVVKDNDGEFEVALSLYKQGIEYLLTGRKYEKNERIKQAISEKVRMYMKRAEEIAESLKAPPEPAKKKAAKATAGGGGGGDGESKEDEDEAKLKSALSAAIVVEKPDIKWDDVAGLDAAKGLLKEAVILPIKFPQLFTGKRKPWQGILLFGPPGTGKSFLAKAVATEADNSTFFSVSSSDLVSKYVGESEKLVKQLFTMARDQKPSIVFIDEIDSLAGKRGDGEAEGTRRIKTEFLVQMQGVGHDQTGVLTLGATNCPWDLDPAIRRRFTKRIYIPLPEAEARTVMFRIHIGSTPAELREEDFAILGERTDKFSGSDISGVVQDALMEPVRAMQEATHFKYVAMDPSKPTDTIIVPCSPADPAGREMSLMEIPTDDQSKVRAPPLKLEHFLRVLAACKPSVGKDDIVRHEAWRDEFGQDA